MSYYEEENGKKQIVERTVPLAIAMRDFRQQAQEVAVYKSFNPVYRAARKLTGIKNFTKWHETVSRNGQSIRESIRKCV